MSTEKMGEIDISAINELLIRSDKAAEQRQKLQAELQTAENDPDVLAAAKASRRLEEKIADLDQLQKLIAQRLEAAKPQLDALAERLEDLDRQADQEHDRKEFDAFNAMVSTPEGKAAAFFLAALSAQWARCPQSRYVKLTDSDAFKSMMDLSAEEKAAAFAQLATPPEREPTSPELDQVRDIQSRLDAMSISAPEPTPVNRPSLTVCPISAEQVKHEKGAQQRRAAAMNAVSNGTATDADRELLGIDNTDPNNDDELVQEIA